MAKALRVRAEKGDLDLAEYPLLMHVDDILTRHGSAGLPWDAFTFENL